jgi:hypothetical protein
MLSIWKPGFTLQINIKLLLYDSHLFHGKSVVSCKFSHTLPRFPQQIWPTREHLIYTDIQPSKLGLAAWCDVAWTALNPGAHWGTPRSHRPQFPREPQRFPYLIHVSSAQKPCWLMSSEIVLTNILGVITSHILPGLLRGFAPTASSAHSLWAKAAKAAKAAWF